MWLKHLLPSSTSKELALLCSSFWQDTAALLLWSTARGEWHKGRDGLLHQIKLWQIIKKLQVFYIYRYIHTQVGKSQVSPSFSCSFFFVCVCVCFQASHGDNNRVLFMLHTDSLERSKRQASSLIPFHTKEKKPSSGGIWCQLLPGIYTKNWMLRADLGWSNSVIKARLHIFPPAKHNLLPHLN